jgi:hypothetical protein
MTLVIDQNFTQNCEDRKDGKEVQYLILHYTGCTATVAAARWLDPSPNLEGGRLSTHYLVDERGRITQFVHEHKRAWHAGRSYWRGETDINSTSIGIEIENLGEYADYPPFNNDQIAVVIDLCADILKRHPGITPMNVLGHSDIAPGRKLDPGPNFPWARLAAAGIGVYPGIHCHPGHPTGDPGSLSEYVVEGPGSRDHRSLARDDSDIESILTQFGYNPDAMFDEKWTAFCTHYAPEGLSAEGRESAVLKLNHLLQEKLRSSL